MQIDEVKAIRPQDIIKVEYHDMPGSRYADAPAVIDFIVRYKNDGGNLNGDFTNGITMFGFGNYQLSANYHKGKSELKPMATGTDGTFRGPERTMKSITIQQEQ